MNEKLDSAETRGNNEFADLFEFSDEERESLLSYERRMMEFRPQFIAANSALDILNAESTKMYNRLAELAKQLERHTDEIQMSQNIDLFYMAIIKYGRECGWTEDEIKQILKGHIEYTAAVTKAVSSTVANKALTMMYANQNRKALEMYNKYRKNPPRRFKGNEAQWLTTISKLDRLTLEEEQRLLGKDGGRMTISRDSRHFRIASADFVPEWYESNPDEIPDEETLLADWHGGEDGKAKIMEQFNHISRQQEEITAKAIQKGKRTIARNNRKMDELRPGPANLSELIMFLADTDGMSYYDLDFDRIDQMSPKQINASVFANEAKEEKFIRDFVGDSTASREMVRLFLAKKLDESKLFELDEGLISLSLSLLLENDQTSAEKLRAASKKTAQKLIYDVLPLISSLDEDAMVLLREELKANPFLSREEFVKKLAEFIAGSGWEAQLQKETARLAREYKRFAFHWIQTNWREAYGAIYAKLHPNTLSVPEAAEDRSVDEETKDLESSIAEVQLGNLLGWEVVYDVNKNGNGKMETIEAESLEAMESKLEEILLQHRISCSIKLSSVVHTLEWVTTLPQQVRQIMIRETVNGKDYLKIKRGNVRIFFQIDQTAKRLVFFVYQKQSMAYHF